MAKYKAYLEYRDYGVEWLKAIPEHWKLSKLRYQFVFGKGLTITKEHLQDEGIPCVNYGEVHSKYGFEVDPEIHTLKCVSDKYLKDNSNSLLAKGDIVFADTSEDIDGSGNFTQLVSDTVTFAGYHTIIARPFERENSRFYAYLLDCKELRSQVRHAVKGVKVFSITQAILRNLSIWLPSKDEQAQIAAFLDHEAAKIDNLIEKQQQLIELLKEKRQAVISNVVAIRSNEMKTKLKNLVNIQTGYPFPSSKFKLSPEGNIALLRGINVGVNSVKWDDVVYWGISDQDKLNTFLLESGDIVLGMDRPWISAGARVAEIKEQDLPCFLLQRVARIRASVKSYQPFIKLCLSSNEFREYAEIGLTGVSVPHISPEQISDFYVRDIAFDKQVCLTKNALNQLDKLQQIQNIAEQAIQLLQERRTALISAAVTGKIDVRDWVAPEMQEVEEPQETTA
jgi:type I restriction enzyme S subunit